MKIGFFLLIFCLFFPSSFLLAQSSPPKSIVQEVNQAEDIYLKKVLKGASNLALTLYRSLEERAQNSYFSAYSLAIGLSMVGQAANDSTRVEIEKTLQFPISLAPLFSSINAYLENNKKSRYFHFIINNNVWIDQNREVIPAYLFSLKRVFDYVLQPIDFSRPSEAFTMINQAVFQQTQGKIPSMLLPQDVTSSLQILLTSGFYFHGTWVKPFDPVETKKMAFKTKNSLFNVEMMRRKDYYLLSQQPKFTLIELPYRSLEEGKAQMSLTLLLPAEGVSLEQVKKELTIDNWYFWMNTLKPQLIDLFLPKFRVEDRFDLSNGLKEMGMSNPFLPTANFSIASKKPLALSKVIQRAIFHVNEGEGSRLPLSKIFSQQEEAASFIFNKPFIFILQERTTRLILGIGKLEQPY